MGEAVRRTVAGIRSVDWVLAGVLGALGLCLMLGNVSISDQQVAGAVADGSMAHSMSSHSWVMIPVFLLACAAVLWWRRGLVAVTVVALIVMCLHVLLFGWVTRCGAGLPIAFVLTYLAAVSLERSQAYVVLGLTTLLMVAVLVMDATTEIGGFVLALPVALIVFGVGRAVRARSAMRAELQQRTTQLRQVRDERVSMQLAGDRLLLSRQLDDLLRERLDRLATAAEAGPTLDTDEARRLFETIESGSRATLDDMREIVGLLRGGDVALAPTPSVAHLDALLARRVGADSRLSVTGDPRALPATVELSAYRIVEHLVDVLAARPSACVDVGVHFEDDVLRIRVTGPVKRTADLKTAARLARERATLHGGSLQVKVVRGNASAVAQLPVVG